MNFDDLRVLVDAFDRATPEAQANASKRRNLFAAGLEVGVHLDSFRTSQLDFDRKLWQRIKDSTEVVTAHHPDGWCMVGNIFNAEGELVAGSDECILLKAATQRELRHVQGIMQELCPDWRLKFDILPLDVVFGSR